MRRRSVRAGLIALALGAHAAGVWVAGAGAAPGDAPPPTPVNGTPSPFQSRLHTPSDPIVRPPLEASSALLADLQTGDVLLAKRAGDQRPIASLTKVMTALVVLETTRLDDRVTVAAGAVFERGEYGATSTLGLRRGERLSARNLLYGALLGSANDAARALAIHVAGSEANFVALMNERAGELGMRRTRFASATGLDDAGRSTARDVLRLADAAFGSRPFTTIVQTRFRRMPGPGRGDRRIQNRNVMLWLYRDALGGKTGSTAAAGFCLMAAAERDGRRLVAIVLGAPDEAFSDAASLLNHGFEGFERRTLVADGQALGTVRLQGGAVPVEAGEALEGLVRTGLAVRFRADVDPDASYPPGLGEVIGRYRALSGGLEVGSVPLVVSKVPGPRDPGGEPWWVRAAAAIAGAVGAAVASLY